jgi:hypothetical protein
MKVKFEMGQRVRFKAVLRGEYNITARIGTLGEVVGRSGGAGSLGKIDYAVSIPGGIITVKDGHTWMLMKVDEEMEI